MYRFKKLLITGEVQATSIFELPIDRRSDWQIGAVKEFILDLGMEAALTDADT